MASWSGARLQQFHRALLAAFPNEVAMQAFVRFHLDESLLTVAGSGSLYEVAFKLLTWAEAHHQVDALLKAALAANPDNQLLQELVTEQITPPAQLTQQIQPAQERVSVFDAAQVSNKTTDPNQPAKQVVSTQHHTDNMVSSSSIYKPNPFRSAGRVTDPAEFIGRETLLHELFEELGRGCSRALLGEAQVGKSSILEMVCRLGPNLLGMPANAFLYLDLQRVYDEQDFFEALCGELGIPPCRGSKLSRYLKGRHYILCLDEIEKMGKEQFSGGEREELRGLADGQDTPFTLVIASRVPLEDLFPDRYGFTSPLANICPILTVPPFNSEEAQYFLEQRLQGTGVHFTTDQVQLLITQSSGCPGRLQKEATSLYDQIIRSLM